MFVQTSQRAGFSKKLAKPFKGPYTCLEELSNGNLKLVPMTGGRTITIHKNNCKLAPQRFQHLNFDDPETETDDNEAPESDPFRFSAQNPSVSFDDLTDYTPPGTNPEPTNPPDPLPPDPPDTDPTLAPDPNPGPGPAPLDPGLRQNEPPGPPKTRAAARVPGHELPALPGIAHDRLPIERALKKIKKVVKPK